MRRCKGVLLAGMLMLSMSVPVYADKSAVVKVEAPADTTDYYMTVDSGGVGVDIYPSTDGKGEKLNDKTVRDGTVLHIEGETEKNGETWGYTKYNGRYGYVPLEELRPSKDAELAKAGIAGSTEKETSAVNQGDASDTQNCAAGEVQGPPAADGTTEGGGSVDEAVTKPVNGTAATSFKEENSWYKSPFIWIGIATVLAVIGILGYHLKKR